MSNRETTKLTLENEHGAYSVEIPRAEMEIGDVFEDLVVPTLVAAGYLPESVDKYLGEGK